MSGSPRSVLQVVPYYPPHLGGIERVAENLAAGLAERHRVRVLTSSIGGRSSPRRCVENGVLVHRHRSVEIAHTPVAPGLLVSLLRQPRRSVVHLHSGQALVPEFVALAAMARRRPFVLQFHLDVDATGTMGWLLPAYKKHVFTRVMRAAAAVLVLTHEQADYVRRVYGVDERRVHVVPNGVEQTYFMAPRENAGSPLDLLYVGRLSPQKNVGLLLEAMSLVSAPVRLHVVGDGELRERLEAQAARLGLDNVVFAGPRYGPELVDAYAKADALVLPSEKEGMALVALEGMAAALPIIATDVVGNADLLRGVGLLTDPTPAALGSAIDTVATDAELRRKLSRQSAAAAPAYQWDTVVQMVERIYTQTLP